MSPVDRRDLGERFVQWLVAVQAGDCLGVLGGDGVGDEHAPHTEATQTAGGGMDQQSMGRGNTVDDEREVCCAASASTSSGYLPFSD